MERSTRPPIAVLFSAPAIRSPSQCPGTVRSATSAGRSLIITDRIGEPLIPAVDAVPADLPRAGGDVLAIRGAIVRSESPVSRPSAITIRSSADRYRSLIAGRAVSSQGALVTGCL